MFNYNPGVNNNAGSIIMQAQQNADNTIQQGVQQATQGITQAMQNYGVLKARGEAANGGYEMLKDHLQQLKSTYATPTDSQGNPIIGNDGKPMQGNPQMLKLINSFIPSEADDKRFYSGNLSTKEAILSTGNTLLQHALTSVQQQQQINAQTNASYKLAAAKADLPHPHTKTSVPGDDGMYIMDNETGTVTPMMVNGRQVPTRKIDNDPFGLKSDLKDNGGSQMPPSPQASTAPVGQAGGGGYPARAVADLRSNPNLRSQFDAKFGAGSSKAILGY
jgi:hypothetical protein